ncbi:hypothetical protein [Burkholderia cenocepacia]|uniref:Uncharacterized protein n=1 Tax=Burkholderia cenocepacia TaxID=95486 RepID=A0A6B2ME62_9BURK|nr:hypothetical protein [Burkholderia cenocepacia]NDV73002.1 hypothetical protein [Burkholderia cenocepacia]
MTIKIDIRFTDRATLHPEEPNQHFSYDVGVPFPETGDFIEIAYTSGPEKFQVAERVFSYAPDGMTIQLLLDLPQKSESQEFNPDLWKKLAD